MKRNDQRDVNPDFKLYEPLQTIFFTRRCRCSLRNIAFSTLIIQLHPKNVTQF